MAQPALCVAGLAVPWSHCLLFSTWRTSSFKGLLKCPSLLNLSDNSSPGHPHCSQHQRLLAKPSPMPPLQAQTANQPQGSLPSSPDKAPTQAKRTTQRLSKDSPDRLWNMMFQSFKVNSASRPELAESCWLCYEIRPPDFEGTALIGNFSETENPSECRR